MFWCAVLLYIFTRCFYFDSVHGSSQYSTSCKNINYLLTESKVLRGKSRTETLSSWQTDSKVNTATPGFDIFRGERTFEVYNLFVTRLFALVLQGENNSLELANQTACFISYKYKPYNMGCWLSMRPRQIFLSSFILYIFTCSIFSTSSLSLKSPHGEWTMKFVLYSVHGWILPKFFFCVFMDWDRIKVHEHVKNRMRPISSHLNWTQSWPIKNLSYGKKDTTFLWDILVVDDPGQKRWHFLGWSGDQSQFWFILPSHRASHTIDPFTPKGSPFDE